MYWENRPILCQQLFNGREDGSSLVSGAASLHKHTQLCTVKSSSSNTGVITNLYNQIELSWPYVHSSMTSTVKHVRHSLKQMTQ